VKHFKEFCAKKVHDGLYGPDTYYGHPFQKDYHPEHDFKLFAKDLGFTVNPSLYISNHLSTDDKSSKMNNLKVALENLQDFTKQMSEENFFKANPSIEVKMDMGAFNQTGLSLKQMLGISKQYHTDEIWVAGDGNDWEMSEYTSGHDSELIIKINVGNPSLFLSEYQEWEKVKDLSIAQKKKKNLKKPF